MEAQAEKPKLITLLLASRPKFLTASAAPVLVGSALAYAIAPAFSPSLFILALLSIMMLHAGANMANDYFDHTSGNDWVNENPTPFSGGSRYIQRGLLSPKETLLAALVALALGAALGLAIVLLTRSLFILVLGLVGVLGGFFYTAPPIRLGYCSIGELVIAILFGLLPVCGSYYLQTTAIEAFTLAPAAIVGILVFLIILVNEFPDLAADAAVDKRTLVVCLGVPASIWIYRITLIATYIIAAAAMLTWRVMFFAGLFYLLTLPMAVAAIRFASKEGLTTPGQYRPNQTTILLHTLGSLALVAGFLVSAWSGPG
ncbi:MAG: 1,4-dihydroxy-2-naphthoate octaprenyltransferase [Planctomycetota bacterium]